jgi:uncharacterized protein (DUF305 family)
VSITVSQKPHGVHRLWRVLAIAALVLWLTVAGAWWAQREQADADKTPVATGFMRDMVVHHHQAVNMALVGAIKGSAEVQALSLNIIRSQSLEMGMMQAWTPRYPTTEFGPMMGWMSDKYALLGQHIPDYDKFILECQANPGQMPGMATLDELNLLQQSSGKAFNRLWISLMLRHHSAAIVMIRFAADHSESDRARNLASSMLRDQVKESAYLITLAQRDGLDVAGEVGR